MYSLIFKTNNITFTIIIYFLQFLHLKNASVFNQRCFATDDWKKLAPE